MRNFGKLRVIADSGVEVNIHMKKTSNSVSVNGIEAKHTSVEDAAHVAITDYIVEQLIPANEDDLIQRIRLAR